MTHDAQGFSQGTGRWAGGSEVYDPRGHFLGFGHDRRLVSGRAEDGKVRIEVSFHGPFQLSGHYDIDDRGSHRVYRGPANYGFAEVLAPNLVDAHGYWPDAGLSQRFFMMVLPGGEKQLSLALMSRGERLRYSIVGENDRVPVDAHPSSPTVDCGEPSTTAPTEDVLLHRPGRWRGFLSALDRDGQSSYEEIVEAMDDGLRVRFAGGFQAPDPAVIVLRVGEQSAWSGPGDLVGSYSLVGGRALVGTFHRMSHELRLWRREVVAAGGACKAVVHLWYRGRKKIGAEWGVLDFEPQ